MEATNITWLEAADNPWGVLVLDVRPITLGMTSCSSDPQCAENAVSYGRDDGTGFINQQPQVQRTIPTDVRFRRDRLLADGALFLPGQMEHKWAIYFHAGRIYFIRSWLRTVYATAEVEQFGDEVRIRSLQGVFNNEEEDPRFSVRVMDYLLRSHALGMIFPAPLIEGMENDLEQAAIVCFSNFGNFAHFATPYEFSSGVPDVPLRSHSLLHIAVARGDRAAVDKYLAAGWASGIVDFRRVVNFERDRDKQSVAHCQ